MSHMFCFCESLTLLPDLSNWNISNVYDISYIFKVCKSLISLPDISNWKTSNIFDMSGLFYGCYNLSKICEINKWNMNKVRYTMEMFYECRSLCILPDITGWIEKNNILEKKDMFYGDFSLSYMQGLYIAELGKQKLETCFNLIIYCMKNKDVY